jgi:hypothetical protein
MTRCIFEERDSNSQRSRRSMRQLLVGRSLCQGADIVRCRYHGNVKYTLAGLDVGKVLR